MRIGLTGVFAWALWQRFSLPLDPIVDPDFLGISLARSAQVDRKRIRSHPGPQFSLSRFPLFALAHFRRFSCHHHWSSTCSDSQRAGSFCLPGDGFGVFVPESLVSLRLHDGLGLVGAAIYLLAAETTRIETQLRPEAVCGFLLSLNLYFTLQFIYYFVH